MTPRTVPLSIVAGLLLASAVLVTGCATRYEVKVDAVARGQMRRPEVTSYVIRDKRGGAEGDNLRFKEAARHIRTALSAYGLFESPDGARADMVVEVDYALGNPRTAYVDFEMPVFGRSIKEPSPGPATDSSNDLIGWNRTTTPVVVWEKQLWIVGRENCGARPGDTPPREFWRVNISIEDESRDLRSYLPLLASAAMDRIGRNTDGVVTATLNADEDAVAFIRKGM